MHPDKTVTALGVNLECIGEFINLNDFTRALEIDAECVKKYIINYFNPGTNNIKYLKVNGVNTVHISIRAALLILALMQSFPSLKAKSEEFVKSRVLESVAPDSYLLEHQNKDSL